jgi:glycosyltransferase involved in cell wall biosynthesis
MTTVLEKEPKIVNLEQQFEIEQSSEYKQSKDLIQKEFVTQDQITVLIPTLNEEEAIGRVIDELKSEGFYNILVVDGYSDDLTVKIAKSKGAFVIEQHGIGKGGAIRTALTRINTPYILVMDGDCTYKAKDIHRLLLHIVDHDEVIGARTKGRKNIPLANRFGNWVISKAFKLLFGKSITDVLSGMYLVKTDKLREAGELVSNSFDIEVEIASSIAANGDLTEVPISYGERVGKQKLKKLDGLRILRTLLWMANYSNPLLLFGAIGSFCIIPAIAILGWYGYDALFLHSWHLGYVLLGTVLFLFAIQALAFSLTSLLIKRSERRVNATIKKEISRYLS